MATFEQTPTDVLMYVEVTGLPPGCNGHVRYSEGTALLRAFGPSQLPLVFGSASHPLRVLPAWRMRRKNPYHRS